MAKKIRAHTRSREYVPMGKLSLSDQSVIAQRYPHSVPWLPDHRYLYPVDSRGKLTTGSRRGPSFEEATRLKAEYDVREVMES